MRNAILMSGAVLIGLWGGPASSQTLGKDDFLRQLAPPERTRSVGLKVRRIEVVAGQQDKVIAETRTLPTATIKVTFGLVSDLLTPEGEAALRALGEALADPKLLSSRMLIGGHTDARGSEQHNQDLSERRARSVREFLVAQFKIAPTRLEVMGFAFRKLADPAHPEDGVNRRVEVTNLTQ